MEQPMIQNILLDKFQYEVINIDESSDMLTVTVRKQAIVEVIGFLKEELGYLFLTDLCGIHYPDQVLALGVVYH